MRLNTYRFGVMFAIAIILSISIGTYQETNAQIPPGQDVGSTQRNEQELKKKEAVTEKLTEGKPEAQIENKEGVAPKQAAEAANVPETKVLINKIEVTGVTVFSPAFIHSIVAPYEGKELSLSEFRSIAELITNEYRKKGYVTTIAYLPPQKIENNSLKIAVSEGKVGNIKLSGNTYFSSRLLLHYLDMKKGDLFNYDVLRKDVNYINEHPDRNAKVVLEKGEGPGETDVNMQVKDRLPLHATLSYNNYNSSYLGLNKYSLELKSDNFLGLDHILAVEAQTSEGDMYRLYSGRYIIPVGEKHNLGAYYVHVNQKLGGSVKNLNIEGTGDIVSAYFSYKAIDGENLIMRINPAFDYKNIENKILGITTSKDKLRVAKLGFDFDFSDKLRGRDVITQEFDYGIPDFLDGLKAKDTIASRVGSGGEFFKMVTNVARVQSLPASTSLMLRGAAQYTNNTLCSTEQFNIGGISTVRGYPVSEFVGDRGINASAELYCPPYFLSKTSMYYDLVKFMGFFDWGHISNRRPQVGEAKNEDIYSAGPALRFEIPQKLSVSFDYGFALGRRPSDGSKSRGYIETKLFF